MSISRFPFRIVCHSHGLPVSWSACLMFCLSHILPVSWSACLLFCLSHGLTVSWCASIITCLSQGLFLSWSACLPVYLSWGLPVSWFVCFRVLTSYGLHVELSSGLFAQFEQIPITLSVSLSFAPFLSNGHDILYCKYTEMVPSEGLRTGHWTGAGGPQCKIHPIRDSRYSPLDLDPGWWGGGDSAGGKAKYRLPIPLSLKTLLTGPKI